MRAILVAATSIFIMSTGLFAYSNESGRSPHTANPVLPGYYADPSLVQHEGKFYLFATCDPWGGETLACWESEDFKSWTYRALNWPTAQACTSPTSGGAKVWAPSVVRAVDGRFYMYVSVHNEIWAGVANHPLGPWRNVIGDRPLIPGDFRPGYHMIDAEAFVDDDGTSWLYWGSGWNWKNGKCWAVKLKPDMVTFDGKVHDVTPSNYFEAPLMVKRDGRYYLMYSDGITIEDTYQVHYAIGETPVGPFVEPETSPVLVTDESKNVISPGHHTVFRKGGRDYILYHRHGIPFDRNAIGRQVCVDELHFTPEGRIEKVTPTHEGPVWVRDRSAGRHVISATATASSGANANTSASFAVDDNYATYWSPAPDATGNWLRLDLGRIRSFAKQEIRFEYAWKPYRFRIETSEDGSEWRILSDHLGAPVQGSPVVIDRVAAARYVRLTFPDDVRGGDLAVFEWTCYR